MKNELDLLQNQSVFIKENDQLYMSKRLEYIMNNRYHYPLLFQLVVCIELLFPTSVKCESTFSIMNIIKSDSRTLLADTTLDSLIRIKYSTDERINACIKQIVCSSKL